MPVYQLQDLNLHIRETIAESYPENLWVRAEIASVNPNKSSGHCYLELSDGPARMKAMVWKSTWAELSQRFQRESGRQLEAGMLIQVLVKVEFNVQYSMGLVIRDLDTAYTVGDLAIRRAQSLERLRRAGLLDRNKALEPGFPPQRIAVITSETAAGNEDFQKHLLENPYGYRYWLKVFPATMQGKEAISSITAALEKLAGEAAGFDYAVIIRGGGSRQDLQVFDEFDIAAALARCPYPVLSGIGHERDESLCDLAAYRNLKTPTAVADYIISQSSEAEMAADRLIQRMASYLHGSVHQREQEVQQVFQQLAGGLNKKTRGVGQQVQELVFRITGQMKKQLHKMELEITTIETSLQAGNPLRILELGFARIAQEGKRIKSIREISPASPLKIGMKDGEIIVKIQA